MIDLHLDVRIACDGLEHIMFQHAEYLRSFDISSNFPPIFKCFSPLILDFHEFYDVIIISIGRKLPSQVDHCKRIIARVESQVQSMLQVATTQLPSM